MSAKQIASDVLDCVGGVGNVIANSLCMTRLRITVANPAAINRKALDLVKGVLGTATRGINGIEVVLRPQVVQNVFSEFSSLTGLSSSQDPNAGIRQHSSKLHFHISPSKATERLAELQEQDAAKKRDEAAKPQTADADDDDVIELARLLDEGIEAPKEELNEDCRLLVINGPNINMLGIREPNVYGSESYAALLELCRQTAENVGFVECRCYQSNHEGDLVDQIQDALDTYDGIVINPGAYTHTSIALLDAVKAVNIPTIEVHISKVEKREDFRQVSYIRRACIETITGLGIDGYRVAIEHMAQYLGL